MKRVSFFVLFLAMVFTFFILPSCSNDEKETGVVRKNDFYLDIPEKEMDGVVFDFSCSENYVSLDSDNRKIQVLIRLTNNNSTDKTIRISDVKIIKEETNVQYDVFFYPSTSFNLKQGINTTITFTATVPQSYKEAKYVLSFSTDEKYNLYLYETPDELRKDCKVNYIIGGRIVHTTTIKERKNIV